MLQRLAYHFVAVLDQAGEVANLSTDLLLSCAKHRLCVVFDSVIHTGADPWSRSGPDTVDYKITQSWYKSQISSP